MNARRQPFSAADALPSPYQGVYLHHYLIGGCRLYYRVGQTGRIENGILVRPGMSEAAAVAELGYEHWGDAIARPHLRVVTSVDDASSPLPLSPSVLARICRAHSAGKRAGPRPA